MTSWVLVSWKRAATRYVIPVCNVPRIQCFQEEDLEGADPDGNEEDSDESEDGSSLPSVDDLDGA